MSAVGLILSRRRMFMGLENAAYRVPPKMQVIYAIMASDHWLGIVPVQFVR